MKCPGQDPRYWTGEVTVEVPCPECGAAVEIFRDESAGRCRRCGHRFTNPGADFGCAQWCAMANECLGMSPQRRPQSGAAEGALAARLLQWIERRFNDEPLRIAAALKAFQRAKELVRKEGGDPRVVLCAALLLAAGQEQSAEDILRQIGVEADVVARVCDIVRACRQGEIIDAVEFRVVRDALAAAEGLSQLSSQRKWDCPSRQGEGNDPAAGADRNA